MYHNIKKYMGTNIKKMENMFNKVNKLVSWDLTLRVDRVFLADWIDNDEWFFHVISRISWLYAGQLIYDC